MTEWRRKTDADLTSEDISAMADEGVPVEVGGPRMMPVEQVRAMIRLLWPEEITPTAKRMLEQICDQHDR